MFIIGCDEVGYGACAGSMCAGVAVCKNDQSWSEVTDSKKLTEKKRVKAFDLLLGELAFWAVTYVDAHLINKFGAGWSREYAMLRAALTARSRFPYAKLIVDGNIRIKNLDNQIVVPKADQKFAVVSAASIMAKVIRDRYMTVMSYDYPQYGFDQHKGYGTAAHMEAIRDHGPCPLHRTSYSIFK